MMKKFLSLEGLSTLIVFWAVTTLSNTAKANPETFFTIVPVRTNSEGRILGKKYKVLADAEAAGFVILSQTKSSDDFNAYRSSGSFGTAFRPGLIWGSVSKTDIHLAWGDGLSLLPYLHASYDENRSSVDRIRVPANASPEARKAFYEWDFLNTNIHAIGANPGIDVLLEKVKAGQFVRLEGKLVTVYLPKGEDLVSSTDLNSSGIHGCKIMLIDSVTTL